jgi:hypothetical protein
VGWSTDGVEVARCGLNGEVNVTATLGVWRSDEDSSELDRMAPWQRATALRLGCSDAMSANATRCFDGLVATPGRGGLGEGFSAVALRCRATSEGMVSARK